MSTDTDSRARAGYAGCPQCNGTRRTLSNSSCYTCGWVDTLVAGQRDAQEAMLVEVGKASDELQRVAHARDDLMLAQQASAEKFTQLKATIGRPKNERDERLEKIARLSRDMLTVCIAMKCETADQVVEKAQASAEEITRLTAEIDRLAQKETP